LPAARPSVVISISGRPFGHLVSLFLMANASTLLT
jgi:hypothetical protein